MGPAGFPETRPSLVREVLAPDDAARARGREALAAAYWKPIHAYLGHRWRVDPEEARDLTQEFFTQAFARDLFTQYDPARARLRTWVRLCVDSYVRNAWKAGVRLKRGGEVTHVDLDAPGLELPSTDGEIEAWFEREWLRGLFEEALAALSSECEELGKQVPLAVFRAADVEATGERPGYAELAQRFGIPVTQVTNYLHWCRRRLRGHVLDRLRAQCRTEEEYVAEAQAVFGVRP
jgi:RNA polymerase sigma factor (sigma-70 family)